VSDRDPPQERLRLRPDAVLWRQVGGKVIALSLERSEYLAPSESAIELWRMLADGATVSQLAVALERRWGVSSEDARRDAVAFVAELREQGLLEG
jgi:hypothetical protein